MLSNFKNILTLIIFTLLLTGCGGPFSDYSNHDLREVYGKCDFNKLTGAGAQRCNNLKKECDKRKSETGFRC